MALTMLELPGTPRSYGVWIAPSVCLRGELPRTAPVLLSLSCFGCEIERVAHAAIEVANQLGYIVIAPLAYKHSWNAGECCGDALRDRSPDVAFVSELLQHAARVLPVVQPRAVFALGWSNGGFFATHLAHTTELLAGVVAISGYRYAPLRPVGSADSPLLNASLPRRTPVLLLHGMDDLTVRAGGCCARGPGCCCDIGLDVKSCVGVSAAAQAWALANGCAADVAQQLPPRLQPMPSGATEPRLRCSAGVRCAAETAVCLAESGGHMAAMFQSAAAGFPFASVVAPFLARQACKVSGGSWEAGAGVCKCGKRQWPLDVASTFVPDALALSPGAGLGTNRRRPSYCMSRH
jgi:poly(3-hydroxybutyrate) depolymerase